MRLTSSSCRSEMGEKRDVGIFQLGGGWEIIASFAQDTMAATENGGHPEARAQARPHAEPVRSMDFGGDPRGYRTASRASPTAPSIPWERRG